MSHVYAGLLMGNSRRSQGVIIDYESFSQYEFNPYTVMNAVNSILELEL
jgi:hypothetical protein